MKYIVVILTVLLNTNFSWGQNTKAVQILERVSEKTNSYSDIYADFIFSMKNKEMAIDEKNEGTIKLKGKKYAVKLPSIGVEIFSDGITRWNYMKDGNQVTISDIDDENSELMDDPSSIFTIYERGFRSEFVAEKKKNNKIVYHINLFPDSEEYEVSKIEVFINKATMMIHAATLHGTDGNLYTVQIKKLKTNNTFTNSDFIFNKSKYGDVEEIDFR